MKTKKLGKPCNQKSNRTCLSGRLVSCPRNSRYIAGGQLAVCQGASEAPISESYGSSEQRGKTANWPQPKGLRSKWAVGKARGGSISESIRDRRATQPPAHFHRNN